MDPGGGSRRWISGGSGVFGWLVSKISIRSDVGLGLIELKGLSVEVYTLLRAMLVESCVRVNR